MCRSASWDIYRHSVSIISLLESCTDVSRSPADDPASFVAYAPFSAAATGAATPYGYDNAFMNLTGSSQTSSYAGYTTLSSYNPALCASFCDGISGCVAFNIYFERDPSLDPGTSCPNPCKFYMNILTLF